MLKKLFQLIAVLFLSSMFILGLSSEESSAKLKRHFFKNPNTSMEIPENWTIEVAEDEYGIFKASSYPDPTYNYKENIIASYGYFNNNSDNLETRFQRFLSNVKQFEGKCKILDEGDTILDKYPAKWVLLSQYVDGKNIISLSYILVFGDHEFVIGGYSIAEKFDRNKPLFEKIIESFRLEE